MMERFSGIIILHFMGGVPCYVLFFFVGENFLWKRLRRFIFIDLDYMYAVPAMTI